MDKAIYELFSDNKFLPTGTRIKTHPDALHKSEINVIDKAALVELNKVSRSGYVPMWVLRDEDFLKLLLPPLPQTKEDLDREYAELTAYLQSTCTHDWNVWQGSENGSSESGVWFRECRNCHLRESTTKTKTVVVPVFDEVKS